MNKGLRIVFIALLGIALIAVRMFENELFYDPLLNFFKTDHSTQPLPEMNLSRLFWNVCLRFLMNTILSLGILWFVFQNRGILKVSLFLFAVLYTILAIVFVVLLNTSEAGDHMGLFYVRRFLIQPLFLLILLPAFYFQKRRQ